MSDNPNTFRATLIRLGIGQTEASRLLGVNARTVRGWCDAPDAPGFRPVPRAVTLLLDLAEHVPGAYGRLMINHVERGG